MKDIDLIVFDWDGTLIDSTGIIADCIQAACRDLDLPVPPRGAAQFIIGLGMHDALRLLLPDLPPAEYPRVALRYRDHFFRREADIALFAGVEALLAELGRQGYALAIATGKTRVGLDRALRGTGAGRWFGATRCADECFSKPHPSLLQPARIRANNWLRLRRLPVSIRLLSWGHG